MRRIDRHFTHKGKCTFTAYHSVSNYLKRIIECHERQNVKSRHILNRILVLDSLYEFFITPYLIAELFYS